MDNDILGMQISFVKQQLRITNSR